MFELVLSISHMKLFKLKLKNLRKTWILNSEEQFYQHFPSAEKNYGTTYVIHALKSGKEIIPSCQVTPSQWKKFSYKGGTKIVFVPFFIPSHFSYKQPFSSFMLDEGNNTLNLKKRLTLITLKTVAIFVYRQFLHWNQIWQFVHKYRSH